MTQKNTDGVSSTPTWPLNYPGGKIRSAMEGAVQRLEEEIVAAPGDASNYVQAAEWYIALWCYGFCTRQESFDRATQLVSKATELNPECALAHTMQGVLDMGDWRWEQAERSFRAALNLDPTCAAAHHWYALFYSAQGKHRQAVDQSEQAVELEPSIGNRTGLGAALYFAREFERLAETMQSVVDEAVDFAEGHDWLGMALVQMQRFDEAIVTYEKANELSGGLAEINAGRGHAYGMAGRQTEAMQVANELERQSAHWHIPPVQMAFVYISIGDFEQAFTKLFEAADQKSWELAFVRVEPWLDEVRGDSRFERLSSVITAGS